MNNKYGQPFLPKAANQMFKNYNNPVAEVIKPGKNPVNTGKLGKDKRPMDDQNKAPEITFEYKNVIPKKDSSRDTIITTERLQEAIVWSEILGKPVSRRRKRR